MLPTCRLSQYRGKLPLHMSGGLPTNLKLQSFSDNLLVSQDQNGYADGKDETEMAGKSSPSEASASESASIETISGNGTTSTRGFICGDKELGR